MLIPILIATSFSLGFFIESIIGFGGGLITYSILGFFMNLKDMVLAALYVGTCSSFYIFYTDFKSFDVKIFRSILPISLLGTVLGVFIFSKFSSEILSLIFGILLIILAIKILFYDRYILPKFFKSKLIFIAGIIQGSFGIGGPFWVNALKNDFKNKSSLRTTMAMIFIFFNIVRAIQLTIEGEIKPEFFAKIWWVMIPVFLAIRLGYVVHLKVSEDFFKKLIAVMTIFAGFKFLIKFLA